MELSKQSNEAGTHHGIALVAGRGPGGPLMSVNRFIGQKQGMFLSKAQPEPPLRPVAHSKHAEMDVRAPRSAL